MADMTNYLERALTHVESLPPLSNVFHKILELTEGDDYSRDDLIRCVSLDQAIAAKVLQTINSAYFGMGQRVTSLEVAVGLLGDKQVRDLAIMCTTSGLMGVPIRGYGIQANQFWLHSITTAFGARLIADRCSSWHREEAFAAGLLLDIGKVVLDRIVEEPDKETLQKIAEEILPEHHTKEMDLYGFDHCAIGFFLARKWNFSKELTESIAFHHYSDLDVDHKEMVQVISFADMLSHLILANEPEPDFAALFKNEENIPFGLSLQDINDIYIQLQAEVSDSEKFLGINQ